MVLNESKEYIKITMSWKRKTAEQIAVNLLPQSFAVEMVAKITGLILEKVQHLQTED